MKNVIIGLALLAAILIVVNVNPGITGAVTLSGGECDPGYKEIYQCASEKVIQRQFLFKDCSARYDSTYCGTNEVCVAETSIKASCKTQIPEPEFREGSFEYGKHYSKSIDFYWGFQKGIYTHPSSNPRMDVALTRRAGDELYVKPRIGHSVRLFKFIDDVTYNDCITDKKQSHGRNQPIATNESMCFQTLDGDMAVVSGNWENNRLERSDLIYWRLYLVG
jgi:hypothetical protein|tara:strand:- start:116 stop:778 length:663 start_codon:yes stop_codon:yes gene_type:complete